MTVSVFAFLTITTPEPPAPPLAPKAEFPLLALFVDAPPPPLPVFTLPEEPTLFAEDPVGEPPLPPTP